MTTSETSNQLLNALRQFAPLSEEDFALIVPHLQIKQLNKGELLSKAGRHSEFAGLVLSGQLRQYYLRNNEERTTYFYFEGMLVADYVGGIKKQPAQLTIEALSFVELLAFPITTLHECYLKNNNWNQVGRSIAEYITIGLEERMVDLLTLNAEERYRKLLDSNKQRILERIPQQYIANYLGITPVSFSRLRASLSK